MENSKLNLSAPWDQVKELLKEANFELTDSDLEYTPGKEEELLERLSIKLKKDKSAVKDYIESVSANKGIAS